ncbi:protein of unknown function [Aminobacter niigataensis]|nr:protein of unknown function [Aminobacter niigataensis]
MRRLPGRGTLGNSHSINTLFSELRHHLKQRDSTRRARQCTTFRLQSFAPWRWRRR